MIARKKYIYEGFLWKNGLIHQIPKIIENCPEFYNNRF
jgi:hypothetical protein